MATIAEKKIYFKDNDECLRFYKFHLNARKTLQKKGYLVPGVPYPELNEEYQEGGATSGPFLDHITKLLEDYSEEYMGLNNEEKEIVRLMVADYMGCYLRKKEELSYVVGQD